MDYVLRHFNVTVAKLFERATEIVKAEVQSSSIYFDGMRWEMMISALQKKLEEDLWPNRTVVHISLSELMSKYHFRREIITNASLAKIHKMVSRYLHESEVLGSLGEFCGIGYGNMETRRSCSRCSQIVSATDASEQDSEKRHRGGHRNTERSRHVKGHCELSHQRGRGSSRVSSAVGTYPWVCRTDFEFMGLDPNVILAMIRVQIVEGYKARIHSKSRMTWRLRRPGDAGRESMPCEQAKKLEKSNIYSFYIYFFLLSISEKVAPAFTKGLMHRSERWNAFIQKNHLPGTKGRNLSWRRFIHSSNNLMAFNTIVETLALTTSIVGEEKKKPEGGAATMRRRAAIRQRRA